MPDIWSYRGLNEVIYVLEKGGHSETQIFQHANTFLKSLLPTTNLHVYDTDREVLDWFDVVVDWSHLTMIGIQTKKTLDERKGKKKNACLHIKFYFDVDYAANRLHLPNMNRHASEDFIINTMAKWHRHQEMAPNAADLFDNGKADLCWLAVDDIPAFLHDLQQVQLPRDKNIYIFSTAFEAILRKHSPHFDK